MPLDSHIMSFGQGLGVEEMIYSTIDNGEIGRFLSTVIARLLIHVPQDVSGAGW